MLRWTKFLWPKQFAFQILLVVTLTFGLTISVFSYFNLTEQVQAEEAGLRQTALALAKELAQLTTAPLLLRDYVAVEQILVQAAIDPRILSANIIDTRGHILSRVARNKFDGEAKLVFDYSQVRTPDESAMSLALWHIAGQDFTERSSTGATWSHKSTDDVSIIAWHAIDLGSGRGWVQIELSARSLEQAEHRIWRYELGRSLLAIVAAIVLMWLYLRRPLREILNATAFAASLSKQAGEQIQVYRSISELESLDEALNKTSVLLRTQDEVITAAMRRLEGIFGSAMDAIVTFDQNGRVDSANSAAAQIFGYDLHEVIGSPVKMLIPGLEREGMAGAYALGFQETVGRHKNGTDFPIDLSLGSFSSWGKTIYIGITRDISERKNAEKTLIEAKIAAESANSAKSEFLANMSHEIRTPLNAILGMAEMLGETELTPDQRKYVEVFQKSGSNLLELINDILDLSKVEAGQLELDKEEFELRRAMHEQIQLLAPRARSKGLELTLNIKPDVPPFVIGDAKRLRQCITNLVGNAIKFTAHGGVELMVRRFSDEPDKLLFSVADSGIGIPHEKRATIFEAFTQADGSVTRKFGGTGLGLAITQCLVKLMKGRIWVESEPGQGSTFHFTALLPAALKAREATAKVHATPELGLSSREIKPLSILIAEDNPENVLLIQAMLKKEPHMLDFAENGLVAVNKFNSSHYDLVLMDVQMPEMDGYVATAEIRRLEAEHGRVPTPIYTLTAHAFIEDEQKSLNAGCTGHLTKPIRKKVLLDLLQSLQLLI